MTEDYRAEMARAAASLLHRGWEPDDVCHLLAITPNTLDALLLLYHWRPAEWPKTVTRVEDDGSWHVVRGAA